jgi:phosphoglycerate dehydrogenase-like enzyme
MKIAFLHGPAQFFSEILSDLRAKLPQHELISWAPGENSPDRDIEVLLVQGEVTRALMADQRKLALIHTVTAGYEGIDIDAATDLGIWVSFSPSGVTGNATSVAECAVLLMLGASRHINQIVCLRDHSADTGTNPAMSGKTVCIVGLGGIGRLLVDHLRPFGMRILATDPHPERAPDDVKAFSSDQLHAAVAEADYVVVCARAGKDNENLINRTTMQAMKRGAILINIARGSLIDEDALYDCVKSGQISAAGLDVLKTAPGDFKSPLFDLPQILITPHIAAATDLALHGTVDYIKQVIEEFAAGEKPESVVNAPAQPRRALGVVRQ